jgi:hypothetical protein
MKKNPAAQTAMIVMTIRLFFMCHFLNERLIYCVCGYAFPAEGIRKPHTNYIIGNFRRQR